MDIDPLNQAHPADPPVQEQANAEGPQDRAADNVDEPVQEAAGGETGAGPSDHHQNAGSVPSHSATPPLQTGDLAGGFQPHSSDG